MKKGLMCILLACLLSCLFIGCSKKEETKDKNNGINYVTEELPDKGKEFSKEESKQIKSEITMWATGFLIVDSSTEKKQKNIIDDSLYSMIASDKDREKLKKDREQLYDGSSVEVSSIKVEVNDAYKVSYDNQKLGRVKCKIDIEGKKNGIKFTRKYDIKMIITYEDIISIYEIGSISWES